MGQIQGGDEIITKGRLEAELQSFFNKIKPLIGTGGRQWPVMPQASSAYANIIVQYIGESVPDSYTHAHFYECIENDGSYSWKESDITSVAYGVMDSTDLEEIFDGSMPTVENKMPILFDEMGEERKVGWYRLSDGTKKPVYEKVIGTSLSSALSFPISVSALNIDVLIYSDAVGADNSPYASYPKWTLGATSGHTERILYLSTDKKSLNREGSYVYFYLIIRYTKTTDTPI